MELKVQNSEDLTARQIFRINVEHLQSVYPNRNIKLLKMPHGDIVEIDGELKFNTEGYCFLYNMQRLVKCLEGELL